MLVTIRDFLFPPQCGGCDAYGSGLCARCAPGGEPETIRLPSLTVTALGAYAGPLRHAIIALKDGRRDVAEAFGALLGARIATGSILVPVPTTRQRRLERGFDGGVLLAKLQRGTQRPSASRHCGTNAAMRNAGARVVNGWRLSAGLLAIAPRLKVNA